MNACVVTSAQDPKPVVVAHVTETEINSGQQVIGTVNPLRTSTIGSAIDGRVQTFQVNEGDPVAMGDVLAKLGTDTLTIEQSAAQAELDLAVEQLAELENGSRTEDIAEADANMRSAQAAVRNTESNLKRVEAMAMRSAASAAELGNAREQADAAKFSLKASQALLSRMKQGARTETIAQAKAQVELQRQRLNLINDRIAKSSIRAPFDGFVSAEFTEVGAWITRGDPIAQVIQLDKVEIVAQVTAAAVVHLRKGDVIRVEFPELPSELFTGTIDRIVPLAALRSRTFPVHIKLKNRVEDDSPLLKAGMLARVDLPAGQRVTLPLVPKDALVLNGNDRSVFVIESKGDVWTVRQVSVDLGVAFGDRIQVRGDITRNDRVVVAGNERLTPGAIVNVTRELSQPK